MTQRQIALVTGSTSGIGLGIAVSLAEAGYRLILNGFGEPEVIDQAVADVAAVSASPPTYVGTDLTQPEAIETALAEIIGSEGPISVLVNNAGTQFTAPIDAFPIEKWDQIIALNLSAAFHTTRLCLPGMKAQNFGRIVNIAYMQGFSAEVNFLPVMLKRLTLTGSTLRARPLAEKTRLTQAVNKAFWPHIGAAVKPIVDSVYPLAEAGKAHAHMESSNHIGKIILDCSG